MLLPCSWHCQCTLCCCHVAGTGSRLDRRVFHCATLYMSLSEAQTKGFSWRITVSCNPKVSAAQEPLWRMQQDRQHLFGGEQGAEDDDDEVAVDTFELPPPPANPQVCVLVPFKEPGPCRTGLLN